MDAHRHRGDLVAIAARAHLHPIHAGDLPDRGAAARRPVSALALAESSFVVHEGREGHRCYERALNRSETYAAVTEQLA